MKKLYKQKKEQVKITKYPLNSIFYAYLARNNISKKEPNLELILKTANFGVIHS